jgi:hypothetical protein
MTAITSATLTQIYRVVSSCSYLNQLPDRPLSDDGLSHGKLFVENVYYQPYLIQDRMETILYYPYWLCILNHFCHPMHCLVVEVIFVYFQMDFEIDISVASAFWVLDVPVLHSF